MTLIPVPLLFLACITRNSGLSNGPETVRCCNKFEYETGRNNKKNKKGGIKKEKEEKEGGEEEEEDRRKNKAAERKRYFVRGIGLTAGGCFA
ncbi:hypothetical protein M0802_003376 [Mischocyttarus mexicanus]|nr:hypothetical protein M0802_003376 [Mischocyttarus mexicanus]